MNRIFKRLAAHVHRILGRESFRVSYPHRIVPVVRMKHGMAKYLADQGNGCVIFDPVKQ